MLDFVRIATVTPPLTLGDPQVNAEAVCRKLGEASAAGADIVLFPELCLTGYTMGDLFFQSALADSVAKALGRVTEASADFGGVLTLGLPLEIDGRLYNVAAVISGGRVRGIVPKTFLPTYDEFYEKRWFSSSDALLRDCVTAAELGLDGDYEIPVGRDLLFHAAGTVLGVEICEDIWSPLPPSTLLCLNGAQVILNPSASNETIMKSEYRDGLVKSQSAGCVCIYAYVSSGAGESTTDLVYSGAALIYENGTLLAANKKRFTNDNIIVADADLGRIRADRVKNTTFSDAARIYGTTQTVRRIDCHTAESASGGELYRLEKQPFVPYGKENRQKRCNEIFEMQVQGLRRRLEATGAAPVVGISGGLDSTLALLVSVEAVKRLGKSASEVHGITMPCFGTTDRTHTNALKLMASLGVTYTEIPIKAACEGHAADIGYSLERRDTTYENIQARERTQVLMDYAGKVGGLVVGTGDLSELALGWCTYNADHMSMYGVNSGVPKTLVRWMIVSMAEGESFSDCSEILLDIADTPISPELLPPDGEGRIAQETEDIVGPYTLHDYFLYNALRYGFSPKKIYTLAARAFEGEYNSDVVLKWLRVFYKRFFSQQFKRSCLPDGVKIGGVCLSPRGDWRMPSDACAAAWLRELEEL